MPEVASQTLDFVGRELNVTLAEARTALENYVEQPDNVNLLERCTQELHQVQGVLRVLEIYGAALLAEEMEQVASYLLQTASERKSQAESLDALMRAMVQLPSYLERVLAGGRDLALVLLPLLNDLRAVRGSALLSEGTLLLLNLKSDKQAQPVAASPGEPPLTVEQWARRLRARFQVGLIGWIRGERIEQNLDILAAVAQKLEQIATRQPVFQLWWVTGAVIEGLQENGLEGGVSIKRLLGLGDREIRRLYEQGEPRYAQTPAVELLNNLLYYVGRAESSGPRVMAVRASFRLSELLPVDESIEQERQNLSAPSVKLMQTVAIAIREDLSKVKDVLDIFVRRGAGQPKELASQVEMLRKIGDTLGVLGLGELRGSVQVETERLQKIVDGTLPADEATLVQIAATLIGVEDRLDGQLVGLIRPKDATAPEEEEDNEFQQVQAAVLRECILNLARIKEAITQNVGGTLDAAGLDSWQDLMRGLKAGLLMLGKARAVEVIEGVTGQLKRVMQPGGQGLPHGFMDRLADAIVSVEYYMETLQAGRSDPWYMLDNAQACVQALEHQQTPILPTLPAVEPSAYARTLQITPSSVFGAEADPSSTLVSSSAPHPTTTRVNVPPLAETADPELIKLFIEEAHEELAKVKKFFPAWDQNPMERDSLITVRRSFHTLKGSGRMVGARELGEFAWSIENLLNRVLDNTLIRSPQIVEVLRDSVNALPELVEQLETGRAPRVDSMSIAARAQALAAGKPVPPPGATGATLERTRVIPPPANTATATFSVSNVVPGPTPPKAPAAATPPKAPERPTFAQSAVASGPSQTQKSGADRGAHTQTIVGLHLSDAAARTGATNLSAAARSLSDDSVGRAERSLLELPGQRGADAPPDSFSPDSFASGLNVPELSGAESDVPELQDAESAASGSDPDAAELAAGLENLDLLLPEEPAVEESIILEEEAPLSAGAEEAPVVAETPTSAQTGPDDVLRDIYTRETNTHVATVRAYLDREEGVPEPHAIPEDVYRACHTLSGSSKMAQARHGTRLAEPLDHWLRRVVTSGLGLQNQDMALLADCMVAMEAVVSHLDEATGYFRNHSGLQEQIAQAEKLLDQRIAQAAAEEESDRSFQGEQDELSADSGDFDPEVAAIFCEEAMELIEFSESALSDWRSEPGSADYRSALKRPLHTLKGGARMAGITGMGDLSHELETLVMEVDNGSVPTNDAMFDVIQASLDELARMRESVANGRRVSSARQMIARIHNLTKPRGAALAAAVPTVAAAPQLYSRTPTFQPPPVVPPAPQSYAPPPPALTPAEQDPPAAAESEPPTEAALDAESANFELADSELSRPELAGFDSANAERSDAQRADAEPVDTHRADAEPTEADRAYGALADAQPSDAQRTDAEPADAHRAYGALADTQPSDAQRTDAEPADAEPEVSSDAETQLNRALTPLHSSLPDTLIAPLPPVDLDTAGSSDPATGDLAAELLASYPTTSDQADEELAIGEELTEGEGGTYDLSGSDLADLTGDHSPSDTDAARAEAADGHIATDYMAARNFAANEEVPPVQSWTPESTQAVPTLNGQPHAGYTADTGSLSEDQPYTAPAAGEQSPPWGHAAASDQTSGNELPLAEPPTGSSEQFPVPGQGAAAGSESPSPLDQWSSGANESPASTGQWAAGANESPASPEQWVASANESPAPADQWSVGANESPASTGQWAAGTTESPASTGQWAAGANESPASTGQWAASANESPSPVDQWSAGANESPASPEQWAASANESPAPADQWSVGANESPASTGQWVAGANESPASTGQWAAGSNESAPSTEQLAADANESPASTGQWAAPANEPQASPSSEPWATTPSPATAYEESAPTAYEPPTSPTFAPSPAAYEPPPSYSQPLAATAAQAETELAAFAPAAAQTSAADPRAAEQRAADQRTAAQALTTAALAAAGQSAPAAAQPASGQPTAVSAPAKSVSVALSGRTPDPKSSDEVLLPPQAVPPGREPVAPAERQEMARVDAELLDQLLNISGEASIARSRLEQQLGSIDFNLGELSRTVTRLKEQLRNLEIETEAQILHRHEDESTHRGDFDPLELDRYSSIQQFSRALAETANDVGSIQQLLENLGKETQNLLQQQARTITELQNGLMRTRMVPFQRHVQRLARIVRQAANDTGKKADLVVEGASGELDRQVLERMLPPFEHMLRNAVVHGIEKPRDRVAAGKSEAGRIVLELHREGAEVMVRLIDDGGGMNLKAIRDKGAALGLIPPGQTLSDEDAMQLILEPGFSTAGTITQQAGRGVGMDVVATEIKRLGGALHMETKPGQGTTFTIRLPFTLAISHALVVRTGDEFYALPLPTVEGVLRLSKAEVLAHLGKDASAFDYGGQKYRFQHLAAFVALEPSPLPEQDVTIPVVLVRAGEHSTGLVADELVGSREIVVKSVGPQISSIRGISGATILGDGRIVIILDINALVRAEWRGRAQPVPVAPKDKSDKRTFVMVVDDSITVRRVTQRLLERNGMRVLTARDGMDAVTLLQDNIPDIILLDIEMPRMDGYEVAAHVRNDPRLKDVPIIMITSRVGEKHRARAIELGVDDYLGKPYQEAQLLEAIAPLVERRRSALDTSSGNFERLSDARV